MHALLPAPSSGFRHNSRCSRLLVRYSAAPARIWAAVHTGHSRLQSGNPGTPVAPDPAVRAPTVAVRGGAQRPADTAAAAASGEPYRSHNARNRIVVSTDGSASS